MISLGPEETRRLPPGWRWAKLSELGTFESGGTPAKNNASYWQGDIPFVTGADIIDLYISSKHARAFLSEEGLRPGKTGVCQPGTVLLVTRTRVGRVGIARELMAVSQDINPFFCGDRIQPEYLVRYLASIHNYLIANCRGAIIKGLTRDFINNLILPLPSVFEQKRIAAILNERMATINKARAAAEAQIESVQALARAHYREFFGDIIPLSINMNAGKEKPSWKWRLLKNIARLESGHTPSRYHPEWWGGDIPWLALPDIRLLNGRYAHGTAENTNPAGIANSAARVLPTGTVCLSRTASVGFVTILGRPMATSQDFVNWVCGPDLDPEFLMHIFLYSHDYFMSLASGAIHKTVYMPTVEQLCVRIPEIETQKSIASELNKIRASAERLEIEAKKQLKEINALPQALLRQAFNGEL